MMKGLCTCALVVVMITLFTSTAYADGRAPRRVPGKVCCEMAWTP